MNKQMSNGNVNVCQMILFIYVKIKNVAFVVELILYYILYLYSFKIFIIALLKYTWVSI